MKAKLAIGSAVLAAIVIAFVFVMGKRTQNESHHSHELAAQETAPAIEVETVQAKFLSVPERQNFTGTVASSLTADVSAKVMGKVIAIYAREGDRVQAGQVLVQLDNSDLLAQVRQAEAAVAATRAALSQAIIALDIQRTQSQTRIEQARAELNQALEQLSIVKEGARRQEKAQADEGVRQAQAAYERAKEAVKMAEVELQQAREGVKQAEAAFEAAKQQLDLMREGYRKQQIAQAEAAFKQAEANLKVAQATYERFKPLAEEGVITKQRFDEIVLQLESAKAQYESAKAQLSMMREGFRSQEVRQAEENVRQAEAALRIARERVRMAESAYNERLSALKQAEAALKAAEQQRDLVYEGARKQEIRQAEERVKQAREGLKMALAAAKEVDIKAEQVRMLQAQLRQAMASLAAAQVQLSYATITAPFSGVVVKRHVDPGDMASPGMPLLTIVDPSSFRLEVTVPESAMKFIRIGDVVSITVDALGQTVNGRIYEIVPSADPVSRTFIVKISLPQVKGLMAGMFGRAEFKTGEIKGIFVPESAVWREGSLEGVFVIEGEKAVKRVVTTGKKLNDLVEILSGLNEGELVVKKVDDRLRDGMKVRIAQH
ncbi:MAG: efflux RND transporter periplasmic adaptor subunit [Armatimonadetes bacterium]|nr:efflux RND transporter periplasmic adaptor subunit [Armatimonadota bacterium]